MKPFRTAVVRVSVTVAMLTVTVFSAYMALTFVRSHYVLRTVPVREPIIALTFDDGPHPEYTTRMLDQLDARDLHATFFVVGQEAERHGGIVRRIVASGHEVGNHTFSHPQVGELDRQAFAEEIAACDRIIEAATGVTPSWYRAPRGQLTFTQEWWVIGKGQRVAGWTRCLEAEAFRDPLRLAEALEPGDIVLVHDGRLDRSWSADALPVFLDAALERGFRFVTLSELHSMRAGGARVPSNGGP